MPKDSFLNYARYDHGDIHHDCYRNPDTEAWDVVKWRGPRGWPRLLLEIMTFGTLQTDHDPHDVDHDPLGADHDHGQFTTIVIKWK